jgi:hypothetical protein
MVIYCYEEYQEKPSIKLQICQSSLLAKWASSQVMQYNLLLSVVIYQEIQAPVRGFLGYMQEIV